MIHFRAASCLATRKRNLARLPGPSCARGLWVTDHPTGQWRRGLDGPADSDAPGAAPLRGVPLLRAGFDHQIGGSTSGVDLLNCTSWWSSHPSMPSDRATFTQYEYSDARAPPSEWPITTTSAPFGNLLWMLLLKESVLRILLS